MGRDTLTTPGGPCILGQLTTLTPNITLIKNWKQKSELACQKTSHKQFNEKCDSQFNNWSKEKKVQSPLFTLDGHS